MLGLMGFSGSLPLYVIHRYYIFVFIDRANKDACLLAYIRINYSGHELSGGTTGCLANVTCLEWHDPGRQRPTERQLPSKWVVLVAGTVFMTSQLLMFAFSFIYRQSFKQIVYPPAAGACWRWATRISLHIIGIRSIITVPNDTQLKTHSMTLQNSNLIQIFVPDFQI